jgi:hypothetical protein
MQLLLFRVSSVYRIYNLQFLVFTIPTVYNSHSSMFLDLTLHTVYSSRSLELLHCRIRGSNSGDYEDFRLLAHNELNMSVRIFQIENHWTNCDKIWTLWLWVLPKIPTV